MSVFPCLLTVRQVSERFQVSEQTVCRWIKSEKLPAISLGGKAGYRINPDDLDSVHGAMLAMSNTPEQGYESEYEYDQFMNLAKLQQQADFMERAARIAIDAGSRRDDPAVKAAIDFLMHAHDEPKAEG